MSDSEEAQSENNRSQDSFPIDLSTKHYIVINHLKMSIFFQAALLLAALIALFFKWYSTIPEISLYLLHIVIPGSKSWIRIYIFVSK